MKVTLIGFRSLVTGEKFYFNGYNSTFVGENTIDFSEVDMIKQRYCGETIESARPTFEREKCVGDLAEFEVEIGLGRSDYKNGQVFDLHGYDFDFKIMDGKELHRVEIGDGFEVEDSSPVCESDFMDFSGNSIMDFISEMYEQRGLVAGVDYTIKPTV